MLKKHKTVQVKREGQRSVQAGMGQEKAMVPQETSV